MKVEKLREPTKVVYDKFGRERVVKISELCQYCPNENCEGYFRRDAPNACLTFYAWKEGRLTLEQAIRAKYKQNKRHMRIDPIRNFIFELLEDQCFCYEDRVLAGSVASDIVKGTPVKEALKYTPFVLSNRQIRIIEQKLKEVGVYVQNSEKQHQM